MKTPLSDSTFDAFRFRDVRPGEKTTGRTAAQYVTEATGTPYFSPGNLRFFNAKMHAAQFAESRLAVAIIESARHEEVPRFFRVIIFTTITRQCYDLPGKDRETGKFATLRDAENALRKLCESPEWERPVFIEAVGLKNAAITRELAALQAVSAAL